jgi:hypothetical protein
MMNNMVMARHSSSALLKAGWKPAIDILRPKIAKNQMGGISPEQFAYNPEDTQHLGTAVPAEEGWDCWGRIENNVGGFHSIFGIRQRKALFEHGAAPLQRALDEESAEMMSYVKKHLDADADKFNQEMQ